ncbi:MAG: aminoglycoside phosphotransferase [Sciscionella sp.]
MDSCSPASRSSAGGYASISVPTQRRNQTHWLRVVSEEPQWLPGDFWTGNSDANVFVGLAKPRVLDTTEWDEQGWRRVRAEVMTRMPGHPCSPTDVLRAPLDLPVTWWAQLRRTIGAIGSTPTTRFNVDQDKITRRVRAAFGDRVELRIDRWETVHGDLHWSNLLAPEFGLVDWEMWGRGPAGTDAATLYCYSLLVPAMAHRVREVFADVLDMPAGRLAQVCVAARLLTRAAQDYPDLADPLYQHTQSLLDQRC